MHWSKVDSNFKDSRIVVVIFIISFSLSAAFSASSQFFIISSIIFSSIISASFSALARVKLIPSDRKQFQRGALGLKLLSYFQNWNCAKQNISCFETINIFVYFCPIYLCTYAGAGIVILLSNSKLRKAEYILFWNNQDWKKNYIMEEWMCSDEIFFLFFLTVDSWRS